MSKDTCVRCDGTGKNSGGRRCGRCGGDGRAPSEAERLREAATLVVARCEEATRIIGLRDFREVRLYDSEWMALKSALGGSQAKGSE